MWESTLSIVLGALASACGQEKVVIKIRPWLAGDKADTEPGRPGIGQSKIARKTILALREIGLLDDIIVTKEGLAIYPVKMDAKK
jgi:hypothetical protein